MFRTQVDTPAPGRRPLEARIALVSWLMLLGAASSAAGQGVTRMHGRVTDVSGAGVPGAAVAVIQPDGWVRVAVTDADGWYTVNGLRAGRHVVWAHARGFAFYDNPRVRVRAASGRVLNIALADESREAPAATGAARAAEAGRIAQVRRQARE